MLQFYNEGAARCHSHINQIRNIAMIVHKSP